MSFAAISPYICTAADFHGLGHLTGGSFSEATAVSADGSVVVGTSGTASGVQAFRWTTSQGIVPIPIPAGLIETWAVDVSADGKSVLCYGRKSDSPPYAYEGFLWHISGATQPIALPDTNIIPNGMSADASVVVGTSWATGIAEQAFRWTPDTGFSRLNDLHTEGLRSTGQAVSADGLAIVGHRIYDGPPYRDCFHRTQSEALGFAAHTANAASSNGSVVVGGLDNHQTALFEAYRWTSQTGISLLGTPLPDYHSRALAVSSDGSVIVGYVQNNAGYDEQKAFIWNSAHGMRLLQDVLEDDYRLDLSDWQLSQPWASWKATGISADGSTIVGTAINSQGRREAWRTLLGEPPQLVLYVDDDATGEQTGNSWQHAYRYLQDALTNANASQKVVEIRVAQGVYKPDQGATMTSGDLEATFHLTNHVTIKGGHAGLGEINPDARGVDAYETVLSGDLSGDDVGVSDAADLLEEPSRADNSYHVVTGHQTDQTAVLDGFTITGGNANRGYWVAYYGGGITADSAGMQLVNCKIESNVAAQGGGLHIGSGGTKLTDCTFSGNAAVHAGGMLNGGPQTTVTDCEFIDNYADTSGGGTICTDAVFTRCSFIRNRAGVSTGGAVNNDCSAPTFDDCTFIDNTSSYAGGAIYNYEGYLEITHCTFVGNSSDNGGAIYQGDTDTILTGCEFTGNHAVTGGGVSNAGYSDPTLTDCSFVDNRAEYGGGFHNTTGSAPTMLNCSFTGNTATDSGGAIGSYNNYDYGMMLTDCLFSDNSAPKGGAIYNDQGDPTLNGCTFDKNFAAYEGGGLYNLTGSPLLIACIFTENRSDGDGGGMQNDDGSPTLTGCIFTGNFAEDEGGGMCNEDNNAPPLNPKLAYCIFTGNNAHGDGGGICNDGSSPEILNSTFSANSAVRGGAIYNENDGAPVLNNCILSSDSPNEIHDNDAVATATYSNIRGGWIGQGNIDTDPRFADTGHWDNNGTPADTNDDSWVNGDYHLKSQAGRWESSTQQWVNDDITSPCIDTGDPLDPVGLEPFPNGGAINMGAYGGTHESSKSLIDQTGCEMTESGFIGDIDGVTGVGLGDLALLADYWLDTGAELIADITDDDKVDLDDFRALADNWLCGCDQIQSFSTYPYSVYFHCNPAIADATINSIDTETAGYFWQHIDELELTGTIQIAEPEALQNCVEPQSCTVIDLTDTEKKRIHAAKMAHSIWLDKNELLPWNIRTHSADQLAGLFDETLLFSHSGSQHYFLSVVDHSPSEVYDYLTANDLLKGDPLSTFHAVMDDLRSDFRHGNTGDTNRHTAYTVAEALTTYAAYEMRVSRSGCHTMTRIAIAMLRSVNIPGEETTNGKWFETGHSSALWPTLEYVLPHGDNIYNGLLRATPVDEFLPTLTFYQTNMSTAPCQASLVCLSHRHMSLNAVKYPSTWTIARSCDPTRYGYDTCKDYIYDEHSSYLTTPEMDAAATELEILCQTN
jgi:probable HAF family extracellular repeat protein/predicted outer membrane repeat protein